MQRNTSNDANHSGLAQAVMSGGHFDESRLASPPNTDEMHVGTLPGHEDAVDRLAEKYGFEFDRAKLTRRVYIPQE